MKKASLISILITFISITFITDKKAFPLSRDAETSFIVEIDSLELSSFMEGIMTTIMKERKIAGSTLIITYDGETILKEGYGYADIKNDIKVCPDNTLFRIGSISKLFTWISIMQFLEKEVYDIDADINDYLIDFIITDTFEEPVTIRSLLSHTPGFEDVLVHLFVRTPEEMSPISDILKKQMPKRVRPPLQYASYSNHGSGIVQYLIEQASEMSFEDYSERYLFDLLGLSNTTFRQPIPVHLSENMSKGYAFEEGEMREKYFEYVPMTGAGGASTTAHDMGIFMQALLEYTCRDTLCLLDSSYYELMMKPVLKHAEGMNPALHGFMDGSRNNVRIIGHGGDTFWFHSLLAIIPELNLGFFVSFNSQNGASAYQQVFNSFLDKYVPDNRGLISEINLDADYLKLFEGQYKSNRYPHSDLFKLVSIMNPVNVSIDNDFIRLDGLGKESSFWVPIDSLTFRNINNNELIAFKLNEEKIKAEKLFIGNYPIVVFEKIEGLDSPKLHAIILIISLLTFAFILIIWPLIFIIRRKHQRILPASQLIPFPAKLVAWISAVCFVLFYLIFMFSSEAGQELIMKIPLSLKVGLFFPFLAIPFILLMVLQSIILWKMKGIKHRSRLFYYFSIIVFLAVFWQLHYWNLLGWNY